MAVDHYENFPVASLLLPRSLRRHVVAIYRFARHADDIADEGDAKADERLTRLEALRNDVALIERGLTPDSEPCRSLAQTVRECRLPTLPLRHLLDAFSQDVIKTRYDDYAAVLDYCRRSANPVGHLILALYGESGGDNLRQSDAICTSLQLINFWQDVALDWDKGRIYLPLDEMQRFGVSEADLAGKICNPRFRDLMAFQCERARMLMNSGRMLPRRLPGRLGIELRLVIEGGLRILEKIAKVDFDVFRARPVLAALDWPVVAWRAAWH